MTKSHPLAVVAGMSAIMLFTAPAVAQSIIPEGGYVAGEIGGAVHQSVTFSDTNPGAANCDLCTTSFPSSIGNTFIVGGKLGYRISSQFRADFSLEHLSSSKVSGHSTSTPPSTGTANLDSFLVLYNVYYDVTSLPALGLLQPYFTAGMGIARNSLGVTSGDAGPAGPFAITGNARNNFAWDAGIGLALPLSEHLTADLGYRFINLGELRSGTTLSIAGQSLLVTASQTGSAYVHAVTFGLRYYF